MFSKKFRYSFCLGVLGISSCATIGELSWSDITASDVEAAYQHTVSSHPGFVDPRNPGFVLQANRARETALTMSKQVTNAAGYQAVLQAYSAGFRDGHYGVFAARDKLGLTSAYNWPGLFLAWRYNRVFVSHSENDSSLVGATLVQCDGVSAKELVLGNVFAYDVGKPDQPSYWARKTSDVFLDGGNPFIHRPSQCVFETNERATIEVSLSWQPLSRERLRTLARAAQFGSAPEPGVRKFDERSYWVNLPDFSPSDEMFDAMTETIERLKSMREELRAADALVFDMRGNQGGNSRWGVRAIEAVWGADYRESRQPVSAARVDWRISKGNIAHAAYIVDFLTEQGDDTAVAYFSPIAKGLAQAPQGQDYYREPESSPDIVAKMVVNPVRGRVLLLTHGVCASSCLDFVDEMLRLENVTQVGYPTGSDTNYMEVRLIDLPSGYAKMVMPVKVYRNRQREANAYYSPGYRYDGLDWSDEALEKWVLRNVLYPRVPVEVIQ